jgi:hypothetical protein
MLEKDKVSGAPVYVQYEAASGRARAVMPTALRQIEKVEAEPAGGRLGVQIFMAPSKFFIRTDRPDFAALRSRLEESATGKKPLLVIVNPVQMEIMDAAVPPADLKMPVI